MRSHSLLSLLLVSASFPALAATTQNTPLSMNDWHVAPMMSNGDISPSYCAMAAHYTGGPVVTFTRNATGKGSITVDFANAELEKGKRYAVSLNTGGTSQRFTATAISQTQLVLQTGLNKALNDALAAGNPLTVNLDGTTGAYTLAGNTRAFFEFDHCLRALGPSASPTGVMTALAAALPQTEQLKPAPIIETPAIIATNIAPTFAPAPLAVAPLPAPQIIAAPIQAIPAPVPQPIIAQPAIIQPAIIQPAAPRVAEVVSESVLWDESTTAALPQQDEFASIAQTPVAQTPVAPVTPMLTAPVENMVAAPIAPIAAEPLPLLPPVTTRISDAPENKPLEKTSSELSVSNEIVDDFADIAPAAGQEEPVMLVAETAPSDDAKSRLKSKLAQARAEAAGIDRIETPKFETLVSKTPATPAPTLVAPLIEQPVFVPEPIAKQATTQPPKIIPQAKPSVIEPPRVIAAPETAPIMPPQLTAPPVPVMAVAEPKIEMRPIERAPTATMRSPTADRDIQNLLFDNSPVMPRNTVSRAAEPVAKPVTYNPPINTPAPLPQAQPVKQEIIKPMAPVQQPMPKPQAKQEPQIIEPPRFEANEAPINQDVIPSLPPMMPAAMPKTLSVQNDMPTTVTDSRPVAVITPLPQTAAPSHLNTVTPSVGHPAEKRFSQHVQPTAVKRRVVTFTPTPAQQKTSWATRQVKSAKEGSDGSFCLLENSFDNDTKLMIGQRADGYSTLGLNYGIDMLRPGKNYRVTVRVDNEFDEDFTGYAESPHTLVVQMGKKRSFFDTLSDAGAMNVAMRGVASSFMLQNLSNELDAFSSCLTDLGGQPINTATTGRVESVVVQNTAVVPNDPVETAVLQRPVPIADEAPEVMPSRVQKYQVTDTISHPTKAAVITTTPTVPRDAVVAWDNVQTADASVTMTAPQNWTQGVQDLLTQAGIASPLSIGNNTATWTDGSIKGTAMAVSQNDILDAADATMTKAEANCQGEFSSQMGVPETYGDTTAQPMESKCIGTDGKTSVSTWLLRQEQGGTVTAMQVEAPKERRSTAFKLRDKLLSVLQQSDNQTNQNKSS